MKIIKGLTVFFVVGILFAACFSTPEYSSTPSIQFNNIEFKPSPSDTSKIKDSLVLYIDFKDGDGDLGLAADETDFPYSPKNYYLADGTGNYQVIQTASYSITNNRGDQLIDIISPVLIVPSNHKGKLVTVRTRSQPAYDTLPIFPPPSGCINYAYSLDSVFVLEPDTSIFNKSYYVKRIIPDVHPKVYVLEDTLYYQANPNNNNITVEFMIEESENVFKRYDWVKETCSGFDQRFPVLSNKSGPLEGTLRYGMVSKGISHLFKGKRMYLNIQIKDRALHTSNTVTTPPFTLNSIQK